ncbi:AMP-dependent synthetase/ligase [Macrophomina phaseolina MS6]|uniref:AMP-dependent synthetase/ligase n=1 Tax=Macrophomina phaseolina (strain MS6) TaxID=1126212 RepID=K2R8U2_MACPH|nr:AMP-dependent synthetase/ligase [Macrophomina phaseolina MS6]
MLLQGDRKISSVLTVTKEAFESCLSFAFQSSSEFQSIVGVENQLFNTSVFFDLGNSEYPSHSQTAELAITLAIRQSTSGAVATLEYSSSILSDKAASLLAANYRKILLELTESVDSPSGQISTISDEDLEAMWKWNEKCPEAVDACVQDIFRRHVVLQPEALAVCASDGSFTYKELDILSNTLAHFLVENGVGPEVVVPLCFEKSAWATVAMLAVAKAGGAFTFLDSSYPMNRLENIARQVNAQFLLASTSNLSMWAGHLDAFEVSRTAVDALPRRELPPTTLVSPQNLLYLIFTSGSTGKPKGVQVEHSSYLSCALHQSRVCHMDSSSRVLQFASYSFDVSILENFTTLVVGGCICVPDERSRSKGIDSMMNEFKVTWAFLTPSLVKLIGPRDVPYLETLVLGGEAVTKADVETWAGKIKNFQNGYGPTECSIASAINPSVGLHTDAANIGWPVGGLLWVVDAQDHHRLVPVGGMGELAIEGPHLARGYLNDPEKTASAFVDNPEWMGRLAEPRKGRIYLTGDLVRCNPDGSIHFVGRKDTQVKVRGLRIELGEIEHHISVDPLVRLGVVLAPAAGACKKRLVAVLSVAESVQSSSSGQLKVLDPGSAEVRHHVQQIQQRLESKIPGYMVPSSWIVVESFPLTPSGKIDRVQVKRWLESMDMEALKGSECLLQEEPETVQEVAENVGGLEEKLRKVIGYVLNLPMDSVLPNRSFVNLGGDSISAMQVMTQCKTENMAIKTKDILRCKSITELTTTVTIVERRAITVQEEFDTPFDLSPIQQLYFELQPEGSQRGGSNRFNQSFFLRLARHVSGDVISAALDVIVERHSMLRARFLKSESGKWMQTIPRATEGSYHFGERSVASHEDLEHLLFSSHANIDMIDGPVFIVDLINGQEGQALSLIAHHAIVDLVSWRVIMQELEELVEAGELAATREKPLPWQAWCRLQADYARQHLPPHVAFPDAIASSNLEYWGMVDSDNRIGDTMRMSFKLDAAVTSHLTGLECHRLLRTEPIDVFLSALIHSFSRTFKDRGTPTIFRESHGRQGWDDDLDITSVVGWFTSMYPVHVDVAGEADFVEVLKRVKDSQRRVPRNGWPYFASRYNHADGIKHFGSQVTAEVQFDYLGLYQQLEREGALFEQQELIVPDVGPDFKRFALFEITAEIIRGEFQLTFEFNVHMRHQGSISEWIQECERSLRLAANRLASISATQYTLSDFPLLPADYESLDQLITKTLPGLDVSVDNVEDVYPLSPMQTGLLLSQAKSQGVYQYFSVFRVEALSAFESVDSSRLIDAWQSLIERHSSLRTIFVPAVTKGDAFDQVVLKKADARVSRICCSKNEVHSVLNEHMHIPFQDARPPHKLTICEVAGGEVFVRIDINHALVDGSSVPALVRDFTLLYDGRVSLPKAPLFSEYIAYIQSCNLQNSLRYWIDYLDGVEPCYFPILDDGVSQDGSIRTVRVEHQVTVQALTQLCQARNITLPTLFKAVWALVLQAYTGSRQVCFGYLVSGRDIPINNIDSAIGAFINMLVCRVDLADALGSVLDKIQEDSVTSLQHQHCSLADIQHGLSSDLSAQPLFNSAVNFQMMPVSETLDSSVAFRFSHHYDPTEYSIAVDIAVSDGGLDISLVHTTTSLATAQAKNVASTFAEALELMLSMPAESQAAELHLLSHSHLKQIWNWNNSVPPKVDMCIHDIISRQMSARPMASAVESWDDSFTYKQLDDLSSKLAAHLAHSGVRPGVFVPLCFEKSAWTIVALLSVLKAGGAFALLDPAHGSSRMETIVEDVDAHILLSSRKYADLLAQEVDSVIVVDQESLDLINTAKCCDPAQRERRRPTPSDPAYIIFTSGSTGKPKGSYTPHSGFATSAAGHGKRSHMSSNSRVLQYASYSFDACLMEILTTLMFGGCVCIPSEQQRLDNIVGAINDACVNWAVLTPSVTRLIEPSQVPTLDTLVMGGEAMSKADIQRWDGHTTLHNGYGPSECGVAAAWNEAVRDDPTNIGKSVGGVCWIVDPQDHHRLMPVGAIGELIVEGFAMADGYLNNKTKTDEAFVPMPEWLASRRSAQRSADRLYKTGDLVRYNSDGSMTFIGRKDMQAKFHGQRIEFGEIEHHLLSRADFTDAVAVEILKPTARQGQQTLVAFFAIDHTEENDNNGIIADSMFLDISDDLAAQLSALQDGLTTVLPPYMVPSAFIPLAALPRNASGKLDRKSMRERADQLPASQLNRYALLASTKRAPRTEQERKLQAAWAETLDAHPDSIGSDTSFFRVGGDSIGAMRMVSIAREKYGLMLTVADIFNQPRLCDMAAVAKDVGDSSSAEPGVAPFALFEDDEGVDDLVEEVAAQCGLRKEMVENMYPCAPLQEGLMALSMKQQGAYIGQSVFILPPSLDITRFKRAWEDVFRRNPILRTRIVNVETAGTLQVVLTESISWLHSDSLQQYLKDDLQVPITWGGSLGRFALIMGKVTHFVWTAHHSLFDGWSQGLIFQQLEQAYRGNPVPELAPFSSFIYYLTSSDNAACEEFWSTQLAGETPATFPQLPSGTYTPRANGRHERTVGMVRDSRSDIITSTIIRAAWALVLGRYTDSEDVVFGATMSGRNAPVRDIERINGPTITTVPVKVHLNREQPICDMLEAVQNQATDMIPHEHWGLQNITQVSRNAHFQNLLVIQPSRSDQSLLGLEVVPTDEDDFNTYALCMECILAGDKIELKMTFDPRVVPHADQLAAHFEHIIRQLADRVHDDAPISSLDYCSPEDRVRIFDWNRNYPHVVPHCIHDLVQRQARSTPNASAVCSWDVNFTYAELDIMSTRLAKYLVTLGVKAEKAVPAIFEKSAWAVVAQLAILKAGGVMCMLDPSHPEKRLSDILETVEGDLILSSDLHADLLQGPGRSILVVNADTIEAISKARPITLPKVDPKTAAYIVFTSGTTGRPKGSVTEHQAFASQSSSLAPAMHISSSSRVLQYSAYSFDPYILETFTTLMQGGCVCIIKDEARTNPAALVDIICAMGITWALLTPSVARLLPKNGVPSLKTLVLGGEAMASSDKAWSSVVRLQNAYGPSECSVASVLSPQVTAGSEHACIGKGVGTICWIVDPHNHNALAPVGCVGELLLESPGLSRGYLKEPKKTADVFIDSPAWLRNIRGSSRLYKTGDLVRYNPADGTVHFVGRKDLQVKLHGQRLELGEIEHHTSAHGLVGNAAVTLPKAGFFKGKLVATISLKSLAAAAASDMELELIDSLSKATAARQLADVRSHLENQVPAYMVPSVWTVVYGIPLTTSLKINKRKITAWLENMPQETCDQVMSLSAAEEQRSAPATPMELRLQGVIGRVLNLATDQVLLNRSFLGLGGDSITAMQVVARCRSENIAIRIKDIMQSKSLAQLAECASDSGSDTKSFEKESVGTVFDLTPIQKLYFAAGLGDSAPNKAATGSYHFNQSSLLQLKIEVPTSTLAKAVEAIVGHHSMLRARFRKVNGAWTQLIRSEVAGNYRFQHHKVNFFEDVSAIIAAGQRHLDPYNGAVFSVDSIQLEAGEHLLFLAAHHLVIDLVSWRILLQDLEEFLNAGKLFTKSPLSFQTWSKLQADYVPQHVSPQKALPFDVPQADYRYWGLKDHSNTFADTVDVGFSLDVNSTSALLGKCNDAFGTEPMDLFISALLESFSRTFQDRALPPIYSEGHGREPWDSEIDLSGTVGWFTTICPVYVPLHAGATIADAVRRTKDARRAITENGWAYFASRFLSVEGEAAFETHWPMEIMFNYLGLYQQLERDGALLQQVPLPSAEDGILAPTSDVGSQGRRMALFEISAEVSDGKATLTFTYNRHTTQDAGIRQWISAYEQSLVAAVHQLSSMAPERTLSDFPLLPLAYDGLDKIQSEILPQLGLSSMDEVSDMYPCSPMQQGILISQSLSPENYKNVFLFSISSQGVEGLDLVKLQTAWQKLVARHSTLRTVFVDSVSGQGVYDQIVLRSWFPRILHFECSEEDAIATLQNLPAVEYGQNEPAHRLVICRTEANIYMKLEISHALIDGSSLPVLLRDLTLAYEGKLSLNEAKPPLYRDYVAYINNEVDANASLEYWKQYLGEAEPCHFPVLRDGQPSELHAVEAIHITLDAEAKTISSFCRARGLTPANLFQVAWALVLRAYTGMDRVCFGYLTSGRDAPVANIEHVIGAVCNMLVVAMDMDKSKTIKALLEGAQEGWTDSLQHQFTSLADIQHHQGTAGRALFNTGMSFRSGPKEEADSNSSSSSLRFDTIDGHDPSEYDVTLNIWGTLSQFQVSFNYRPACMTPAQAQHVANAFTRALSGIVARPDTPLQNWPGLVSESDIAALPTTNTTAPRPTTHESLVHELFFQNVQSCPNNPAVCTRDGELSYRELDSLANRLANHLASLGIAPEVLVPVCMEKSAWVPVALLSVLKAGGAFVPMDATQTGRFQAIIEQVGARVVLTSAAQAPRIAALREHGMDVDGIVVDEMLLRSLPPGLAPYPQMGPKNAAYVLFTSGSTGVPKGVVIEHRAWCASAEGQREAWGLGPRTRMLQFASYSFDAAMGELLSTLMFGGCVCIPSEDERLGGIEAAIRQMGVNTTIFTPSFIRVLDPARMPAVHTMVLGGESTPKEEIRKWAGTVKLIPAYGPTECSLVSSSVTKLTVDTEPSNIGFTNVAAYWIVDPNDHNTLAPIGAIGELLIEGPILARGYLDNPAQTAAAFVSNPAWARREPGQPARRMYKTGDLAQRNADGSYRYIGRKDTQVKLRGQRIELGEVEHHLKKALGSKSLDAAAEVLKFGDSGNDAKLAAFIALGDGYNGDEVTGMVSPATQERLRDAVAGVGARMAESAPRYMIPTLFIPLRAIPLSPSCKTDRKRLRAMAEAYLVNTNKNNTPTSTAATASQGSDGRAQQLTGVEQRMRELWASVLNVSAAHIGADDGFFAHGGDSILAIKLVAACRAAGLTLSVADVLRSTSLAGLCRGLSTADESVQEAAPKYEPFSSLPAALATEDFLKQVVCPAVSTPRANILDVLEATDMQASFVTTGLLKSRGNTNYFLFQLAGGSIDAGRLEAACRRLVAHHPILRTSFVAHARRVWQVVLRSAEPEFGRQKCAKWRQMHLAAELVKNDRAEPASLGRQLVRFWYLDGGKQGLLVMRVSHAQYDGVSIPVLVDDLAALYEQGADGESKGAPPQLPVRPVFAEFAHAAKKANERGEAEEYWFNLLDGANMTNVVSHKSPPYAHTKMRSVVREMPIPRLDDGRGTTTFATVLKAAWALVLARAAATTDVVFGHLVSGRNMALPGGQGDVDEVLGPCLNLIPVRVQLDDDNNNNTASTLLRQVYDQHLAAIPFETLGFPTIVERCTAWPLWTRFSTVVQHQNLDGVEDTLKKFRFGGAACKFGAFPGAADAVDILVLSNPVAGTRNIELSLHFSDKVVEPGFVGELMDTLVENIAMLTDDVHARLPAVESFVQRMPQIPMLARCARDADGNLLPSAADKGAAAAASGARFENAHTGVQELVRKAWDAVLLLSAEAEEITSTTCFYNVWGNLIAAAQLAEWYRREAGVEVSMEDVIENPTMVGQAAMLEGRMGLLGKGVGLGKRQSVSAVKRISESSLGDDEDEKDVVPQQHQGLKLMSWARAKTARLSVIGAKKSAATVVAAS